MNKVDAVAVRFKALMESIFIPPTGIQLAPSEIDFMEVLRGAGAAMYGVKGGDGVIIINSRRGPQIFRLKIKI